MFSLTRRQTLGSTPPKLAPAALPRTPRRSSFSSFFSCRCSPPPPRPSPGPSLPPQRSNCCRRGLLPSPSTSDHCFCCCCRLDAAPRSMPRIAPAAPHRSSPSLVHLSSPLVLPRTRSCESGARPALPCPASVCRRSPMPPPEKKKKKVKQTLTAAPPASSFYLSGVVHSLEALQPASSAQRSAYTLGRCTLPRSRDTSRFEGQKAAYEQLEDSD